MLRSLIRTCSSRRALFLTCGLLAGALGSLEAQAVYVVDDVGDDVDATVGDGICDAGAGACTLRAAIEEANATAGLDTIRFDIPTMGPHTIEPELSLPDVTDPVVIDGFTQAGASANTNPRDQGSNAVYMIVIDAASTSGDGLEITAGGSTVRGVRIENAPDYAIALLDNGGNTIEGNHLLPGSVAIGVYVETADNTIGGPTAASRNVIGGGAHGIMVFSGEGNLIQGNLIGTDLAGTSADGNSQAGITLLAPGNTVGGDEPGAGNVISGNGRGIFTDHGAGATTLIQGNLVGTDVTGTAPLGNTVDGMFLQGMPYTVGGTTAGARNVIAGNSGDGIDIGDNADDFVIQGNYIGVDVTGTAPMPNSQYGIDAGNSGHLIGGTEAGAGNVIGGSGAAGIRVNASNTTVQGNLVGVDAAGTGTVGNVIGIEILHGDANTIGGTEAAAANVVSGNVLFGIELDGNSSGNVVQGNYIGTNAAGASLGNGVAQVEPGVLVDVTEDGNVIQGNTIAFNGAQGVLVEAGTGVRISENLLHSNGGLGIDLGSDGVTANDAADTDSGPNGRQNFPLPALAYLDGGTVVEGTLHSTPFTSHTLEFFASSSCDAADHGEGAVLLGTTSVTTDGAGDASFAATLPTAATAGDVLTATATDPADNTSEFSPCIRVNAQPAFVVTVTDDDADDLCSSGHCSLREAIEAANARAGTDAIHFDIPGDGPHTIQPATLPDVTDPVVIDGYTQPGSSPNTNPPDDGTNAVWTVVLDAGLTSGAGLEIHGGASVVRGLRIQGAPDVSIELSTNGGNTIEGNHLLPGSAAMGIYIETPDNTIGGTTAAARNVIGGGQQGVWIEARGNVVQGNLIGTDPTGAAANGNSVYGIWLAGDASTIGGAAPGAGNVISANGFGIYDFGADSVVIQGNLIGTDVTGTVALGNTDDGMFLSNGMYSTVAGNVVSGNGGLGIYVSPDSLALTGNLVGTDVTGTAPIPNGESGFEVAGLGVVIGGTGEDDGNVIAFNGEHGVLIPNFPREVMILGNSIHSNSGLGIDVAGDGVTANGGGGQSFPTIGFALTGSAELEGTLSSAASTTFRLEFFSNDACDGSGHGEGRRYLGFTTVTTDGSGEATFAASLAGPASPGDAVTATATDEQAGMTSEFSACVTGVGYDLAAVATEGTAIRGQDATYDVTVTSLGGALDRDVTLSCEGLPAGASCAFDPAAVQPGDASAVAVLTLSTTSPATPTGASDFTVVGTFGAVERTAAAEVVVTDFSVAASPPSVTVAGGQNAAFTVTVSPEGGSFGAPVSLACAGLPNGAACSFVPAEVTPGSADATSTLTVSTAPLAAGGRGFASRVPPPPGGAPLPLAFLWLVLAAGALALRGRGLVGTRAALALLALVTVAGLACRGEPAGPGPQPVTTAFTIIGTSGDLEHSAAASLTVE